MDLVRMSVCPYVCMSLCPSDIQTYGHTDSFKRFPSPPSLGPAFPVRLSGPSSSPLPKYLSPLPVFLKSLAFSHEMPPLPCRDLRSGFFCSRCIRSRRSCNLGRSPFASPEGSQDGGWHRRDRHRDYRGPPSGPAPDRSQSEGFSCWRRQRVPKEKRSCRNSSK